MYRILNKNSWKRFIKLINKPASTKNDDLQKLVLKKRKYIKE